MKKIYEERFEEIPQYEGYRYLQNVNRELELEGDFATIKDKHSEIIEMISFRDLILKRLEYSNNEINVFKFDNLQEAEEYVKDSEQYYAEKLLKKLKIFKQYIKGNSGKEIKRKYNNDDEFVLKENQILYTSWGYDQTNVEFFKVVRIIGKNYFVIQEVARDYNETGFLSGQAKSTESEILKKLPMKGFIDNRGYMSVCESGYKRGLYVDKGEEHYTSSYA